MRFAGAWSSSFRALAKKACVPSLMEGTQA